MKKTRLLFGEGDDNSSAISTDSSLTANNYFENKVVTTINSPPPAITPASVLAVLPSEVKETIANFEEENTLLKELLQQAKKEIVNLEELRRGTISEKESLLATMQELESRIAEKGNDLTEERERCQECRSK